MAQKGDLKMPKNYFTNYVQQLQWAGVPMYDVKHPVLRVLYLAYSGFMLGIFLYYYTFSEISFAFENTNDLDKLLFTLSYAVIHVTGCAKITVILLKRKSIMQSLEDIENGRFLPNIDRGGVEEIKLVKRAVSLTSNQIMLWAIIILVMLSNKLIWTIAHPLIEYPSPENASVTLTTKRFPYTTAYVFLHFDMQKSPYFEIVYIHQILSIWIFAWYIGNCDVITNGLMIHLTAQFKIVANSLLTVIDQAKRIYRKDEKTNNSMIKIVHKNIETEEKYGDQLSLILEKCVKDCVQHHQDILNLSESMENTFNLVILMQFLSYLSLYCFLLYQLSTLPLSIKNTVFIGMCLFLMGMIFQLYLFCWNGNELSVASEAVAIAAYNASWIPASKNVKMMLLLVILRAQRPVYITAGKFSKLSMATFATVLRGSVSYFMVLRNMNDIEE